MRAQHCCVRVHLRGVHSVSELWCDFLLYGPSEANERSATAHVRGRSHSAVATRMRKIPACLFTALWTRLVSPPHLLLQRCLELIIRIIIPMNILNMNMNMNI